jgi:ketosteroid isomerase-like protein
VQAALETRDPERMVEVCDPDVEWHTLWPGLEQVYRGHDGIRAFGYAFLEIFEDAGQEVLEVVELDADRVFLHTRVFGRGRGSGTPAEMHVYDLWTFKDGLLVHRRPFYEREQAEKAAGLKAL